MEVLLLQYTVVTRIEHRFLKHQNLPLNQAYLSYDKLICCQTS